MSVAHPTEPADTTDTEPGGPRPRARRRRGRRLVKIVLLSLAVLLVVVIGGIYLTGQRFTGQVHRFSGVFAGLDEASRPPATAAKTFLLVGSDSLSPAPPAVAADGDDAPSAAQRADMITLVRIGPGYTGVTVVSLPGDSWVDVPGHGMDRLSAGYDTGGPSLLIRTMEHLTHIRVDHFAVLDFAGIRAVTDALGGIEVNVASPVSINGVNLARGPNHLDGAGALAFLRRHEELPGGDVDRVRRRQETMRALLVKVGANGLLSSPVRGYEFLDTLSRWINVDDTMSDGELASMVWRLRGLEAGAITFVAAPVSGLAWEGTRAVVRLDSARATELWQAVAVGDPGRYLRKYPGDS
jgi:LCP family protein required for cell wall assembly